MRRYRSIEEVLEEEDELGLLNINLRPRATRSPERERDAQLVTEVNAFFERHGRVPDAAATDHDEMRLGMIWSRLVAKGDAPDLLDVDRSKKCLRKRMNWGF